MIDWQKLRGRHKLIMKAKIDMIRIVGTIHMMRVTGIKITSKIAILGRRRIISKGSVVKILGISFSKFLI